MTKGREKKHTNANPIPALTQFTASNSSLHASPRGAYADTNPLANVTVLGVQDPVSKVTLNGAAVPRSGVSYDSTSKALFVTGLKNATSAGAWKGEWVMKWS